ncbi:hypothetical protein WICMUC_004482 [Wickerhamomyces mucosus]|uniref:Uncharacterized protein n=1 Tax=Wickerhamomyces mucosus TaxID=1378264 RepID=A0A9P8TB54_9ASCO|nr:hypothetical protein WICMUC_004482 [Wickerhamomyces mucosus]
MFAPPPTTPEAIPTPPPTTPEAIPTPPPTTSEAIPTPPPTIPLAKSPAIPTAFSGIPVREAKLAPNSAAPTFGLIYSGEKVTLVRTVPCVSNLNVTISGVNGLTLEISKFTDPNKSFSAALSQSQTLRII